MCPPKKPKAPPETKPRKPRFLLSREQLAELNGGGEVPASPMILPNSRSGGGYGGGMSGGLPAGINPLLINGR